MSEKPVRRPLISVEDALSRLLNEVNSLGAEAVSLAHAHNRILAEDLFSLRTQPPFSASAMDGYAVRSADLTSVNIELDVIGEVAAGYMFDGSIRQNQAVRIFTGAPLPDGADSILIQEDAEIIDKAKIRSNVSIVSGNYVRPAGLDFSEGDLLLEKGRVLDAGALSLAASGNHAELNVIKRPIVGILATGDELRAPGSNLEPGQIIASNSYGVAAIASEMGADVVDLGIARDTKTSLESALADAHEAKCDILVTLGGASVGDHDLVRSAFIEAGMTLGFWKIAMQPGKPLMFGALKKMRILGLPGNPVSSLVCSHLFLAPLIANMAAREYKLERLTATLRTGVKANGAREQYARAIITKTPSGYEADVFENQDSSILSFYAAANGLIIRPPAAVEAKAGEIAEFIALRRID